MLPNVPRPEARAVVISITVGILLLGLKFGAYFVTGSTAIFADAVEGFVNVTAACFAAFALVQAHRPADDDHPYGHGKIEFFSAGLEGGMILVAAIVSIAKAVVSLARRQHVKPEQIWLGIGLMAIAMAANGVVGWYLVRSGKRQSSITLEADGWHLMTDAVTSAVAIVALLLVWSCGWWPADPLTAIAVSFWIAYAGVKLIRRSAAGLMDEQDAADAVVLNKLLDDHVGPTGKEPAICSYHKLRHRHSGRYHWVDFHLVLPAGLDIAAGHKVASAIEHEIEIALGEGDATAHVEPCATADCAVCQSGT